LTSAAQFLGIAVEGQGFDAARAARVPCRESGSSDTRKTIVSTDCAARGESRCRTATFRALALPSSARAGSAILRMKRAQFRCRGMNRDCELSG
jgi:hypothetical protein